MAISLDTIKRDFSRNKGKAGVLGVLAVVMAVFVIKAVFEMSPRKAEAEASPAIAADLNAATAVDAEERIKHSRDLWNTLRESRGMDASVAFTFDASFYPLDPKRPIVAEAPEVIEHLQAKVPLVDEEADRRTHLSLIREQARALTIRSTVVGHGNTKPVAVINEHILSVGDHILGFEITSIKARAVEFKKEGITLAVKMSDDRAE